MNQKPLNTVYRMTASHAAPRAANEEWVLDFVENVHAAGRATRVFTITDAFARGYLVRKVDMVLSSCTIARELDQLIAERGVPQVIRCEHRHELTSRYFKAWAIQRGIMLRYLPGRHSKYATNFAQTMREAQE